MFFYVSKKDGQNYKCYYENITIAEHLSEIALLEILILEATVLYKYPLALLILFPYYNKNR